MNGRKTLTVAIKLTLGRREAGLLLVLALLVANPGRLATETLTLTTYYPSPYGVYNNLRSTQDSFFAYTSGQVRVGTTANTAGTAKLGVSGSVGIGSYSNTAPPANGLIVSGNVGIGTSGPGSKLSVNGGLSIGSYAGNAAPTNGLIVSGNVGIGKSNPGTYQLSVANNANVDGYAHFEKSCSLSTTPNGTCAGYVSFIQGIYQEGSTYQSSPEVWGDLNNDGTPDQRLYVMNSTRYYCCSK